MLSYFFQTETSVALSPSHLSASTASFKNKQVVFPINCNTLQSFADHIVIELHPGLASFNRVSKAIEYTCKTPTQPTESVQNTKPTIRDNHDPRPYGRVISTTRPQKPRTNQPVRTNLSLMPYRPCTSSMQQMNVNPNPVPYEYVGFRNDAANSNECIFFCFCTKRTTSPRFNSRGEKRETKPPPLLVQLFKRA